MTKRPPIAVILLVIVICFALGLLNVLLRDHEEPSSLPTPFIPSPSVTASSIRNILIVGLDNLAQTEPKLRATWIATYRNSENIIYLHGIPVNSNVPGDDKTQLNDVLNWSSINGLNQEFLDALYEIIPLRPTLIIVLDDSAFAKTIDYLGGIDIRGKNLDGESILTFLSLSWDQPEILIQNQADIIRSIIPKALALPESPELTQLFALIPDHVNLSLDISEAVGLILPLRKTSPESIFIIMPEGISP
jgi:hypothetical protein